MARWCWMLAVPGCDVVDLPWDDDDDDIVDDDDHETVTEPEEPTFWTTGSPEASEDGPVRPDELAGESAVCWFLAPVDHDLGLVAVGMDSGRIVGVARYAGESSSFHTYGMTWFDGALVLAAYDGNGFRWLELDVATGGTTWGVQTYAMAVGSTPDALVTLGGPFSNQVELYADFEALAGGFPPDEVGPDVPGVMALTVDGTTLYGAWGSAEEVVAVDILGAGPAGSVPLGGEVMIRGLAVAGAHLYLLDNGIGGDPSRVHEIDLATGDDLRAHELAGPFDHDPSGLWCDAG